MLNDLKYKDPRSWDLMVYHMYVADSLSQGFKWIRYERIKNTLTLVDLRKSGIRRSVTSKEAADRYERWYKWMKSKNNKSSEHTA